MLLDLLTVSIEAEVASRIAYHGQLQSAVIPSGAYATELFESLVALQHCAFAWLPVAADNGSFRESRRVPAQRRHHLAILRARREVLRKPRVRHDKGEDKLFEESCGPIAVGALPAVELLVVAVLSDRQPDGLVEEAVGEGESLLEGVHACVRGYVEGQRVDFKELLEHLRVLHGADENRKAEGYRGVLVGRTALAQKVEGWIT